MTLRSTFSPTTFARPLALAAIAVLGACLGGCLPRRAYDSCSVNADCPVGTTCQQITAMGDRMCTTSCSTSSDCPRDRFGEGARCMSFDGGANFTCWQACAAGGSGSECPFAYGCFTSDATGRTFDPICLPDRGSGPTPTQRPYENCSSTSQCLDATTCTTINGVGMCTDTCRDELDCPLDRFGTGARCMSFDGGSAFTCFQACSIGAGGAECSPGWGCYDNDGTSSFPPICLPN